MKHLVRFVILCSLLLILSCQSQQNPKHHIGVSQCSDDLWRQTMNNELHREALLYPNLSLEIKTVKDNTQQQIKDIERFIDQKVDLLIVSPNESKAITAVVQKAYRAGIPVILVDRKIDTEDYTAYVGADNYQIGKELAIYVADVLKGHGNIVEIRGWKGSTSDTERHNGFQDEIRSYSGIHIVAEKRGNFLKDVAEKQMEEVLKEHTQIDLVFAMNDPMALGVHEAVLKYSGKIPFIVGIDALPGKGGGIENIRKGIQDASFIYPTGGDKVIDLAVRILHGEPVSRENTLYTAVVDKSNARVIQLQTNQIFVHQEKLEAMNQLLNKSLLQYSNQRLFFLLTILVLVLITSLLILLYFAYKNKSRINNQLEEQKEQLILLSQQLEEATNAKLIFFTNISHELKTPLTLILGPVETLLLSSNLSQEQNSLLQLIKLNSKRLVNLISQIIEFRSFENGKMNTEFTESDLNLFLKDLNSSFTEYIKRKEVCFSYKVQQNTSFRMWYDKEKIERIYFNLISNAFKYVNKGGHIDVKLSSQLIDNGPWVYLEVFNEGKIIPQDQLAHIFNRFYKVDHHEEGAGIGLALTSVLVDIHRGRITVESAEGVGTSFCVLIPYEQDHLQKVKKDFYQKGYIESQLEIESIKPVDDRLLEFRNENNKPIIIIIEDHADMRNYIRLILENEYTVIEAVDGNEGIEHTIKYMPDIVISDVMIPSKDGFKVCKQLKNNIITSHIPIILLTACSLDEQKAIGFESGADAYIPKPFNSELLKIRIRKLIENRKNIKATFSSNFVEEAKKNTIAQVEQDFVDKFRDYVNNHISDTNLNVDGIAKQMGLSRVQLYRKIKSLTDYSPNELVRIIRLKQAAQLLSSGLYISEIAYQTGFSSSSYFTKCFKEFYKVNPSDYLKH